MEAIITGNPGLFRAGGAYAAAGVDIDAGNALVEAIKPLARSTARPGAEAGLGGFGALFDLKAAGFADPVLVTTTDGVGTKLRVAIETGRHDTIGIDLVAMCVNDLIVQGAEPLLFLDYYASGKLNVETGRAIVSGIAEGCRQSGCALVGGETAEMPGMYAGADYDLAGFALGAAERGTLLPLPTLKAGDAVLGLASSGLHSNGFALVRRVVEDEGLGYDAPAPFDASRSLGEALLEPTRLYVKSVLHAVRSGRVKALAHITGGGLIENIPRVLPDGLGVWISAGTWPVPPVFRWLARKAAMGGEDMARTFNCGIGMVAVVAQEDVDGVTRLLTDAGEKVYRLGEVEANRSTHRVTLQGAGEGWPG